MEQNAFKLLCTFTAPETQPNVHDCNLQSKDNLDFQELVNAHAH